MTYIEHSLLGLRDVSHSSTTYHVGRDAPTNKSEVKIKRTRAFIAKPSSCSLRIPTDMLGVDWILGLANEVWNTVTTRFHHLIGKPMRGFRETSVFFRQTTHAIKLLNLPYSMERRIRFSNINAWLFLQPHNKGRGRTPRHTIKYQGG
jgi:hypothetical protein